MDKEQLQQFKERAKQEKSKMDGNDIRKLNIVTSELIADGVYQLTRIVDAIANPLLQVDKDGTVHAISPSCGSGNCGALRTAVGIFLEDFKISGIGIGNMKQIHILTKALSADACKLEDNAILDDTETGHKLLKEMTTAKARGDDLAGAVEKAIRNTRDYYKGSDRKAGDGHGLNDRIYNILQSALDAYREVKK